MQESGVEVPALLNRPQLNPEDVPYWEAFQDLTGSRQWTQAGPTSIPYSSVLLWLDENLIQDSDDRGDYIKVLHKLDSAYLKIQYDKPKPKPTA